MMMRCESGLLVILVMAVIQCDGMWSPSITEISGSGAWCDLFRHFVAVCVAEIPGERPTLSCVDTWVG